MPRETQPTNHPKHPEAQEITHVSSEQEKILLLENQIERLKTRITLNYLIDKRVKERKPIEMHISEDFTATIYIDQANNDNPIATVIEADIDFPEAGNKASIKISEGGDWLVGNSNDYPRDMDIVLDEYALATRPEYLAIQKEYWKERKLRGYDKLIGETPEETEFQNNFRKAEDEYITNNKVSLLEGFKSEMEKAYLSNK